MRDRSPVQLAALVVGGTFLLVGLLGFVPGVVTNHGDLSFAGHHSDAELLGVFQISALHNIVHLLFGVLGLAAAGTARLARSYLVGGGVVYLLLTAYGIAIDHDSAANFVPVNAADNVLHLVLGVGMVAAGTVLGRTASRATAAGRS